MASTPKLYNGDSLATEGYYFITQTDNDDIRNKTIYVNAQGEITILNADGLWNSNTKQVYIKNSPNPITAGTNVGNIILTTEGVKYSTDGNTWN